MKSLWSQKEQAEKLSLLAALFGAAIFFILLLTSYLLLGKKVFAIFYNTQMFKVWLDSLGIWSRIVFVLIRAAQTVVKFIPAEPLEIGAGYAFGVWGGLFYCMLGTILGSIIIILLTKRFGIKIVKTFVPQKKLEKLSFLQDSTKLMPLLFTIYLIPGTPKDIITYLICLTGVKISTFLLVTGIARIPSIITSTWCGAQLLNGNYYNAVLIFLATTAISIGSMLIYKSVKKRKNALHLT